MFHFIATLLIFYLMHIVQKAAPEKVGFTFMGCSILKMMVAIVFLLPLIRNNNEAVLNDVISFFIPYFLFLTVETFFCVKNLKSD